MGKPLIVGRKTFDRSAGRCRAGAMIVVTRDANWRREGVKSARRRGGAALRGGGAAPRRDHVGGGGEIYAQTIARADRLYITEVDLAPEGDARFPPIDPALWREVSREAGVRGPRDDADFAFVEYGRVL